MMGIYSVGEAVRGALGAAARAAPTRRTSLPLNTGMPVLRGSLEAGTFEESFFAVPAKGETDRLLRTARRTLDAARHLRHDERAGLRTLSAAERAIAALSSAAVRVFEEILALARLNRGRVFPTYDHLAEATGLGRATVARALPILERIGFLVRQRRFKRLEDCGAGPRYAQTSNVYRVLLPTHVFAYLPRWMRPAPLPDDDAQRRSDHDTDQAAMFASLNCRELAQATVGGSLGRLLAKLGSALDERHCEYQNDPQPNPTFLG